MKKLLKFIGCLVGVVIICFAGLLVFLSVTEYKPADTEKIELSGDSSKVLKTGEQIRIVTWNLGYGALGDTADFFMDGGKSVYTADKPLVIDNMTSIIQAAAEMEPDILLFQETDRNSSRSHHIDETALMKEAFPGMQSTFANNFKVEFLPYPIPPIGKVDSGILTLSSYPVREASRVKLPSPFKWPVRMANLKRCLAVHRLAVEGTDHELVLINLHLEAYDEGEGKIAQTNMLKSILEEEYKAGNYVIAGGDFNQTFPDVDLSAYPDKEGTWRAGIIEASKFGPEWKLMTDASVPTCRSLDVPYKGADHETFQYYIIDGFIVSDNIEIVSLETIDEDFAWTDHNPVMLEISLK